MKIRHAIWPMGKERTDFIKLLTSCADSCSDFVSIQENGSGGKAVGNLFSDSYNRFLDVLEQIQKSEKEQNQSQHYNDIQTRG